MRASSFRSSNGANQRVPLRPQVAHRLIETRPACARRFTTDVGRYPAEVDFTYARNCILPGTAACSTQAGKEQLRSGKIHPSTGVFAFSRVSFASHFHEYRPDGAISVTHLTRVHRVAKTHNSFVGMDRSLACAG